mmetsp:Transcript_101132/g.241053  ORF Transcript_101132/g.241053 Transcript_101132/m.241053 type:complete len:106 (+) Transcript_101132:650-967(+)
MRKVLIQQATLTMLTILTIHQLAIIPQSATRAPLRSPMLQAITVSRIQSATLSTSRLLFIRSLRILPRGRLVTDMWLTLAASVAATQAVLLLLNLSLPWRLQQQV